MPMISVVAAVPVPRCTQGTPPDVRDSHRQERAAGRKMWIQFRVSRRSKARAA